MKRIILHIGAPKTGSSALQVFLKVNRPVLNKYQIDYYQTLHTYALWAGPNNADFLMLDTVSKQPESPAFQQALKTNPSDKEYMHIPSNDPRIQWLKEEWEHFRSALKKTDTLILSEEVLFDSEIYFPNYWQTVQRSLQNCTDQPLQIDCIVYLRRQDQWILSKYKQGLTNDIPWALNFNETLEEYERIGYMDYSALIDRLQSVFGKKHVFARDYNRKKMSHQRIESDFLETMGLPDDPDYVFFSGTINPSITMEVGQAMYALKRNPLIDPTFYSSAAMEYSKEHPEPKGMHFLSKEQRMELVNKHARGNASLQSKEDTPFFEEIRDENPVYIPNPKKEKEIAKELLRRIGVPPRRQRFYKEFKSFLKSLFKS